MKRRLLALVAGAVLAVAARAEVIDIGPAELAKLAASGVPVIDIRTEGEWRSTGVIAGSHLATYFDANGRSDPAAWSARTKAFARPDQPVVLVCRSGNRTQLAAQQLSAEFGYRKVYSLSRGLGGWVAEGRPLQPAGNPLPGR